MSLDVAPLVDELNQARNNNGPNAATMTFVVYFEDASIADWIRERTRLVIAQHPARVIVLDGSQTPESQRIDTLAMQAEWIEIGVRGTSGTDLENAVAELALAEAPIVLAWIASRITADDRFPTLARRVQTVICNSSVMDCGTAPQRDLIAFMEQHPEIHVQDLAYLRIAGWQDVIAQFFDERETMDDLFHLHRVEIACGSEAEAYYFLGWLASRLEWQPCQGNTMCNRDGETITFNIIREGPPRRLQRVTASSDGTTFSAQVLEGDSNVMCLEATGEHAKDRRCAPVFGMELASLVQRAILQKQRDRVFQETTAMVKQIIDRQER